MANQNSFGDKVANWKVISNNLTAHLEQMPYLQPIHAELLALIAEAEAHRAEQEVARGRLRELTAKRQSLERKGQTLRSRAGAHLKGTFGFTSEQLIQFGVSPLKTTGRKRPVRKKKDAEAPATTPAPQ